MDLISTVLCCVVTMGVDNAPASDKVPSWHRQAPAMNSLVMHGTDFQSPKTNPGLDLGENLLLADASSESSNWKHILK
jgi:hypothetical protein